MPHQPIFKGVSAIDAAGGIDGFLREVYAEHRTKAFAEIRARGYTQDDLPQVHEVFTRTLDEILCRRLEADIQNRMVEAVRRALARHFAPDASPPKDEVLRVTDQAMDRVVAWSDELIEAVLTEVGSYLPQG